MSTYLTPVNSNFESTESLGGPRNLLKQKWNE
jgi:hypothetical protein